MRAARYLRVSPWELYEAPLVWELRALAVEEAETVAREKRSEREAAKARSGRGRR